jgi:hypothetical protein
MEFLSLVNARRTRDFIQEWKLGVHSCPRLRLRAAGIALKL